MDVVERNVFVLMERENLQGIADYPPPEGYLLKWYQPGDEQKWLDIHEQAEQYAEVSLAVYRREFGSDPQTLSRCQCFLFDPQGAAVGTATAWLDDDYHGRRSGRVHWVAVVPLQQGRGLSKPLMSAVLRRMVELGHERAYLRTSTARIPAINLYARFDFRPSLHTPEDRAAWSQLNPLLRFPFEL